MFNDTGGDNFVEYFTPDFTQSWAKGNITMGGLAGSSGRLEICGSSGSVVSVDSQSGNLTLVPIVGTRSTIAHRWEGAPFIAADAFCSKDPSGGPAGCYAFGLTSSGACIVFQTKDHCTTWTQARLLAAGLFTSQSDSLPTTGGSLSVLASGPSLDSWVIMADYLPAGDSGTQAAAWWRLSGNLTSPGPWQPAQNGTLEPGLRQPKAVPLGLSLQRPLQVAEAAVIGSATLAPASSTAGQGGGVLTVLRQAVLPAPDSPPDTPLALMPAPAVSALRQQELQLGSPTLVANESMTLAGASGFGRSLEVQASVVPAGAEGQTLELAVLRGPGGQAPMATVHLRVESGQCNGSWQNHTDSLAQSAIKAFTLPRADPALCMQACCAEPECTFYTFVYKQPMDMHQDHGSSRPPLDALDAPEGTCQSGDLNCCWVKRGAGKLLPTGECPECVSGANPSEMRFQLSVVSGSGDGSSTGRGAVLAQSQWQTWRAGVAGTGSSSSSSALQLRVLVDSGLVEAFVQPQVGGYPVSLTARLPREAPGNQSYDASVRVTSSSASAGGVTLRDLTLHELAAKLPDLDARAWE